MRLIDIINQYYFVLDSDNLPILWALLSETRTPEEMEDYKPTDVEATVWTGGNNESYLIFDGEQEVVMDSGKFFIKDDDGFPRLIRAYVLAGQEPGPDNQ